MDNRANLTEYVHTIVQTFLQAGVQDVVISPGSRSTPLAYAFSQTQAFNTYMQIDERSAGFFALGLAKVKQNPVLLLCTSGTAAANYFPSIVEANYARIPLIVLTADRPHELREVGAPQAIDQVHLYGNHVKWSVDFPLADGYKETIPFVERHTGRAVTLAKAAPMGPIHINIPFREPLLLDFDYEVQPSTYQQSISGSIVASQSSIKLVEEMIVNTKRGFIIVGELSGDFSKQDFWTFAKSLQWPIIADALSQLRTEVPEGCQHLLIDQYDALLKSENFKKTVNPELVLRFGAQPVSKPLSLFLKEYRPAVYIVIDENPLFRDSLGVATHHIHSIPQVFWNEVNQVQINETLNIWTQANSIATEHIERYIDEQQDEGAFAGKLFNLLPDGSDLISGSSMPIRDVDTFFNQTTKDIAIYANRGTNGIDGVVSTALGIQQARKRPATLLIGDISFLHDSNGLLVSRFHETDLTIVVMNNDGGGIFSYLPQSKEETYFEKLFGTPTGLTFDSIATMYQAEYFAVDSKETFEDAFTTRKLTDLRIIEVKTNRQENVIAHRHLWSGITEELDQLWSN
ncbi:2-succinyl-5-enolpyruvyl-6-hydroxy-3-cyclohexene-1-carboxylic-acid synthase [Paenisporosarcina antarctica]|uniref:2-succinyl-5-enolpyruvyl-6-hydroxy-3-cyclohexene-1-carboxylate synthase n=1 Tax=Paenisporosarcina antarctica TaxID=417367 RepID=A0A4P6ZYK6_9BACL|nr:2-succinyl-5-enolpyruvyl-6-hydroxy-3-cyclohexene-1-carboxylic-acid synthase [Paenisporosarcina antarctica]QBP40586.1 2-succinyl-5-enolpyruvyl-6-hydroxy-3-cyclohexene-1-carboxylic-acid synthase [Paenisporosarcina antarctica]